MMFPISGEWLRRKMEATSSFPYVEVSEEEFRELLKAEGYTGTRLGREVKISKIFGSYRQLGDRMVKIKEVDADDGAV